MKYDLIFFDLDGTLADTAQDIGDNVRRAMAAHGLQPAPQDKVVASVGSGMRKLIERCVPGVAEETLVKVLESFLENYSEHLMDSTKLYPGVAETLNALGEANLVVTSNKPEGFVRRVLDGLGIAGHFSDAYGGDTLPVRKPDPMSVNLSREKFGAAAERCLMVGDSRVDVETARAAGIPVCVVTYGYHHAGDLDAVPVKLDRFEQLLDVVR